MAAFFSVGFCLFIRSALLAALGVLAHGADVLPITGGRYELRHVTNVSVHKPGYVQFPPELPGQLIITSFEGTPFVGKNAVYISDVSSGTVGEPQVLPGSDAINWPNAVTGLESSIFGFPAMALGSGFLVPSHTTGGVWVLEASPSPSHMAKPAKITKDKAEWKPDSGWFYHQAHFADFNGDGRVDVLTSRCQFGVWPWSAKRGELLWLEQPPAEPFSGEPWVEHHLADGPDFTFCVHPDASKRWLVAPEFIGERIVLFAILPDGSVQSRVIDEKSGPGFACSWTDLNGDGRLELLATNHQNQNGSVYAYTFDGDDLSAASFTRHVLASGFDAVTTKSGTASPGDAIAFHPSTDGSGSKRFILVSGDNSNSIFMLVPNSEDRDDWTYTKQKLDFLGADIGRPAIGDIDKDGFVDLLVPAYDIDTVVHYQIAPVATQGASSPIVV